jgi:hypothetical protein
MGGCAAADILACEGASGDCKVLITQRRLAQERKDVTRLVHWDADRHVLYVWSWDLSFGGTGRILALNESDGETIWSFDANVAEYLGRGVIGVQNRVVEDPDQGFAWNVFLIDEAGALLGAFPLLGMSCGWSPNRLWADTFADATGGAPTYVSFTTRDRAHAWEFQLPHGFRPCPSAAWTPRNTSVSIGYEDAVRQGRFALKLWELDPAKKGARLLIQGEAEVDPRQPYPGIRMCTLGTGPQFTNVPPLVVATWTP